MNVRKIDTFSGHRDCVYTLISDASGSSFYSAGGDGLVVKWDMAKPDLGELTARIEASVYAIAIDPATGLLWVGQNYEGIQLIDPVQKKVVASMKIGAAPIFDIKIWREKAFIALGDGVIVVVDIPAFAIQKYLKASTKSVRTLAIRETENELAAGYSDHSVGIFDLETFNLKKRFQAHTNSVFTASYSPDDRYLVTGGRDAHLRVWDATAQYTPVHAIPAHMFAINHLAFRADGAFLATASMDKSIKLWRTDTFRLVKVVDRARHAGHGTSINKLLWLSEGDWLASGSDDRTISVWEFRD
ncbi:WD40 repeat domain-containing protein [Salmonirosea aquatica]|uniref:WD40 repeat domain-containing protein n=1 Tax=Salmonirosea aquatica TaxID=2654236 RepID=A0A7C9B8T4_9BACT|nr:WD40 repeat domain-containing protein [Cytophagaceae bacterium SJW1-29]